MMVILAACVGNTSTTSEAGVTTPVATVTSMAVTTDDAGTTTEPTATPTTEDQPEATPTTAVDQPAAAPTKTTDQQDAAPTEAPEIMKTTIALPTPTTAAAPTASPAPVRMDDAISAADFLKTFRNLGSERSAKRVKELKERYDGRTILEDAAIYVVYLDLTTLPAAGFEKCDVWDGWYRWNGTDAKYSFFKGIKFTDEEYNAGVLEIEVREAVAYGATPGSNSRERNGYWLYFRNNDYVDIYDYTIFLSGLGEIEDPDDGSTTDAELYYREFTDRTADLVFELEHREEPTGDSKLYRISKHVSVLGTVAEVHNVEYYVDTVVKECDNAEDGLRSTVSADFEILDLYRPGDREPITNLAKGSLAIGAEMTIAGTAESEIGNAAKELVQNTVALSGYTFDVRKTDGAYLVHFGDGLDVPEVVATVRVAETNGETALTIEKIELGYGIFARDLTE